jgi:thiamine-monophosphate kinase
MSTEFDFISWIRAQQRPADLVRLGIGDDLAVLNWKRDDLLLVGVDQVLDGVHFDSAVHSPRAIGRKAMNRNLSDCAAMGCLPAAAVVTVALPTGVGDEFAKELFLGIKEAGEAHDAIIVGGDTGSWPGKLVVTVTILGKSEDVAPIPRTAAKPGDGIYVTGKLGGSILGRHMTFEPRVQLGRKLAENETPTAMIDLSDGLSRDLAHLCRESHVGAELDGNQIPIHPDAIQLATNEGFSGPELYFRARWHAIHDGEDYELLFTSNRLVDNAIRIGTIVGGSGILLDGEPLQAQAWEHTF